MKFLKITNPKAELDQKAHQEQWVSGIVLRRWAA